MRIIGPRLAAGASALSLAFLLAQPAMAQSDPSGPAEHHGPSLFGWSISNAGLGVRVEPTYLGSDEYRLAPSGRLVLTRKGKEPPFATPDDGVSLVLVGDRTLSAGLTGRGRASRDNDHDLRGFKTIDWAGEAGGFVSWWPTDWLRLRGEVRHGFGGHHSWIADLDVDAVYRDATWLVSVGPRLHWADHSFTRTYFQVTPRDAAQSPLGVAPYAPSDAFFAPGLLANVEYRLSRHWSIAADADYRRLMGDAADSPIVAQLGSRNQFSTTLGVRYFLGR